MGVVLLADDDQGTRETFGFALKRKGHVVHVAGSEREARLLARTFQPDVAAIDLRLGDSGDGLQVVKSLRHSSPQTQVVVITGFGTIRSAVTAMRLGAVDYLEKPVDIDELVQVVTTLVSPGDRRWLVQTEPAMHATERWAAMIIATIHCQNDPNTVSLWSRQLAMSAGAVRARCRIANVPVKQSLNLARTIRLAVRFSRHDAPANLLNVIDSRTLVRFLRLGRPNGPPCRLPADPFAILEQQAWVTNDPALHALRRELENFTAARQFPKEDCSSEVGPVSGSRSPTGNLQN